MWLKIRAWTKGIAFAAVLVYVIVFVFKNGNQQVNFWWWYDHSKKIESIFLALGSFAAGAVCALLVGTTWRTMRQLRDARAPRPPSSRPTTAPVPAPPAAGTPPYTVKVDELGK